MADLINMPQTAGSSNTTQGQKVPTRFVVKDYTTGCLITLDASLIDGSEIELSPQQINYYDGDCNMKHRWVLASDPEDGWV